MPRKRKPWATDFDGPREAYSFYEPPIIPNDGMPGDNFIDGLHENLLGSVGYYLKSKEETNPLLDATDKKLASAATEFVKAFNASSDSGKEACFRQVAQQTGHGDLLPSEASVPVPQADPSASNPAQPPELPSSPPAWWRDRAQGDTPDKWIKTYYKQYIPAGLTRSFFQRPGQDKALYNALLAWERAGNQLSPDLYLPTKSELNTRQVTERGLTNPFRIRDEARLIKAASRRLG